MISVSKFRTIVKNEVIDEIVTENGILITPPPFFEYFKPVAETFEPIRRHVL